MQKSRARSMRPSDWTEVTIECNQYFNQECAITGYERADGRGGNPLQPVCVFEDRLRETHKKFREAYPDVIASRYHVKMPYWVKDRDLPHNYPFVETLERLSTTSVTVVMVPNGPIHESGEETKSGTKQSKNAAMGFYFKGNELPSLRERLKQERKQGVYFEGLVGNLGYYMTEDLVTGNVRWSHNNRYPGKFHLPAIKSYIGFHLFRDKTTGEGYGSFQGAHPAAVGVLRSGQVEIIPRVKIDGYKVTLWGRELDVDLINNKTEGKDVVLFTPELWTPEVEKHVEGWETYAPMIPADDERVNVFIANEGNGEVPVEKVVKVWRGPAPLPSFGAVLSFDRKYFEESFANADLFGHSGHRIQIEPYGDTDFDRYDQIMGGFVPVVVNGEHIWGVETVDEVMKRLCRYGNATSPIAQSGRATKNFDPRVREPAGVLVQTKDRIGWVLFDGRHELSLGASVVDVAMILKKLQSRGAFSGQIRNAVFIDGGSAMKAYAIKSDDTAITLDLLNRVAAGPRNGPGADPDGLNLYTLLKLSPC